MKTLLLPLALLAALAVPCQAQDTSVPEDQPLAVSVKTDGGLVTIAAKGDDVRNVLFDLFTQSKKSFVLSPNVRQVLYLALTGVDFDQALEIVCSTTGLQYEVNGGVYFLSKSTSQATLPPKPVAPKPLGKLTDAELKKELSTKMAKAPIRDVFAEFARQTGVPVEVDARVPEYRVDAFLVGTSLKYAMDVMTKAAGLTYVRTENKTLRVLPKSKA